MRREKVVVSTVTISNAGEIRFFQIKLPKTALRIIGIELGLRVNKKPGHEPPRIETPFVRSRTICEVKLQSCEGANVFFSSYIQSNPNIGYLDFTDNVWNVKPFSHQTQLLEEPVTVDANTTILHGILRDRLIVDPEETETAINYTVNIYVWLEMRKE